MINEFDCGYVTCWCVIKGFKDITIEISWYVNGDISGYFDFNIVGIDHQQPNMISYDIFQSNYMGCTLITIF